MECRYEIIHARRLLAPDFQRLHETDAFAIPPHLIICYIAGGYIGEGSAMKAFLVACLAAVVVAAIGLVVLNHVQEPVDEAFATSYARV
jgi:hypothetical protein